jgi:hypothetical protein
VISAFAPWITDAMTTLNVLGNLRKTLSAINETSFQGLHFDQRPIEREIKTLKHWLSSSGEIQPSVDLIREALLRFHGTGVLVNLKDARLVCRGLLTPIGANRVRIIDSSRLFPSLLKCVTHYVDEPRKFRRCYRGLLSSYFAFDPDEADASTSGLDNWQQLRLYLQSHLLDTQCTGTDPDWIRVIIEHRNLLTEQPGERYGQDFLEGRTEQFAALETQIGITGSSWLSRSVVLAMVQAAAQQGDGDFKQHLPRLLQLLEEPRHASLLDACLAQLLERYSQTAPIVIHAALCNFAVTHWKNPWVNKNHARWKMVSESARKMVADWLKLDFLKQFFELLSSDGSNDTRRLDFWARYHKRMDDMYFVLGPHAMNNRSPAFVDLRKKMEGRLFGLSGGGSLENNAFIMTMGEHAFIEFGSMGNAAYVYNLAAGLPFDLTHATTFSTTALKNRERAVDRMMHQDNMHGYRIWETRFDAHLFLTFGIRASDDELPEPWRSGQHLSKGSWRNIEAFCSAFGFSCEDRRKDGGQLWIMAGDAEQTAAKQLRNWGFSYRSERGWMHW